MNRRVQSFGGNDTGEQGVDAIGESGGLLASARGVSFDEGHLNIVVSSPAQISEAPNDGTPTSLHKACHYNMLPEEIAQGAVTTRANTLECQCCFGGVQHSIVRPGNRVCVEAVLETKVGRLPAVFSPPPFRNGERFTHSAVIPSCAHW